MVYLFIAWAVVECALWTIILRQSRERHLVMKWDALGRNSQAAASNRPRSRLARLRKAPRCLGGHRGGRRRDALSI
jgi:hypothetical protein